MNVITKTVSLPDGRTISIETGKVAKQCDGAEMPPLGGLYAIMETGWYSVEMTCIDMPLFTFWGEFFVSGPSAVGRLPLDGLEIGISGLRVNVGGLPEGSRAALFSAAGAQGRPFCAAAAKWLVYRRLCRRVSRASRVALFLHGRAAGGLPGLVGLRCRRAISMNGTPDLPILFTDSLF